MPERPQSRSAAPALGDDGAERDLAAFFGPRGQGYVRLYRRRAELIPGRRGFFRADWSWPAFGCWFVWFWYRKLWLPGLLALLVPIAGQALGGDIGGLLGYLLPVLLAKDRYMVAAARALRDADAAGLAGEARLAFLRRRGGVSWVGAGAGTVLLLVITLAWAQWEATEIIQELDAQGLLPAEE